MTKVIFKLKPRNEGQRVYKFNIAKDSGVTIILYSSKLFKYYIF